MIIDAARENALPLSDAFSPAFQLPARAEKPTLKVSLVNVLCWLSAGSRLAPWSGAGGAPLWPAGRMGCCNGVGIELPDAYFTKAWRDGLPALEGKVVASAPKHATTTRYP